MSAIVRHERAPVTDAEWAEALAEYATDRDARPWFTDSFLSTEPSINTAGPSRPLVVHTNSNDSLDDIHGGQPRPSHRMAQSRQSLNQIFSLNPNLHVLDGTIVEERRQSAGRCSSDGTIDDEQLTGVHQSDASRSGMSIPFEDATRMLPNMTRESTMDSKNSFNHEVPDSSRLSFPLNDELLVPRRRSSAASREEDRRSAEGERRNLRDHFEREGWLAGPVPSRTTRLRRIRAIRRLGLIGDMDHCEGHTVMSKYIELALQIFNTSNAAVNIHNDHGAIHITSDPRAKPSEHAAEQTICSHSMNHSRLACSVVADISKDWRFAKNPLVAGSGFKFYAAAPLRIIRQGRTSVDIGTLCIADTKARDTFDEREQGILLKLANMLVYQLATLQSEIVAQRSSTMYEASIAFLRRSVMPDQSKPEAKPRKNRLAHLQRGNSGSHSRSESASSDSKTVSGGSAKHNNNHGSTISRSGSTAKRRKRVKELAMAVKTGPRDSKDAKLKAQMSDQALFTDAATTLRSILRADAVAMVDMDEYQLFIRKNTMTDSASFGKKGKRAETKESIIADFLQGKEWPAHIEPVVHYVPRAGEKGVQVLGIDAVPEAVFNFGRPGVESTLGKFIKRYLTTRHFWWDREDPEDELSEEVMALMPSGSQTTLATTVMGHDGRVRFAIFASWNRPPASFSDSSCIALPFVWILSGSIMASLAIRKIRSLEQSQISYSNLQAHELRTPLHQILAITQLLRSAMSDLAEAPQDSSTLTTTQQIRDLLPFLDAIDTSGKTLHGIVDNILSFLDLKAKDNQLRPLQPGAISSPGGAPQSLEVMFEELIQDACEEDKRWRRSNGQPAHTVTTIFEIIPPLLGEQVTEDAGYALRRALSKILSNAYKFIDGEGCVEIYVDDVPSLLPPEGYEDISLSKTISIKIVDSGRGMDTAFVQEKLGEPWAKEDLYATGSGLSVHLSYRIIDILGGEMEIRSAPKRGCEVLIEVPVPRRTISMPSSPLAGDHPPEPTGTDDPAHLAVPADDLRIGRKVHLAGFDSSGRSGLPALDKLGECLQRQYVKLGCEMVSLEEAELIIAHADVEIDFNPDIMNKSRTKDIVFLVAEDHEADPQMIQLEATTEKTIRRFKMPATPSILRESLFPGHSRDIKSTVQTPEGSVTAGVNSPDQLDAHGRVIPHKRDPDSGRERINGIRFDEEAMKRSPNPQSAGWKPRDLPVEEAVASLSLGDYFSSRRQTPTQRTPSTTSSGKDSPMSTPTLATSETLDSLSVPEVVREKTKVLVVEDNVINRKILVKILSSKLPIDILEAEDGHAAVEVFRDLTCPTIVLLDINMPRMDGYQACVEMRAMERRSPGRGKAKIIAVTALASEAERRRGLVESGMDDWLIKPCAKATITKAVEDARKALLEL